MAIKISGNTVIDDDRSISANNATFSGNGFIKIPTGTTAQRPNSSEDGMIRYNTSEETVEYYANNAWITQPTHGPTVGRLSIGFDPTIHPIRMENQTVKFTITNYDVEYTPNVSVSNTASVSVAGDTIYYTPLNTGAAANTGTLTLDGVNYTFMHVSNGHAVYTTPGTYSWTCPDSVYRVSVLAIGAGGGSHSDNSGKDTGGGGGGLGWKNDITVVPGQSYTVVVGEGGDYKGGGDFGPAPSGGNSYFVDTSTVAGFGGEGGGPDAASSPAQGGGYVGDGGGNGGDGGGVGVSDVNIETGGGGAGGYSGDGGAGGGRLLFRYAQSGAGGGGSGGSQSTNDENNQSISAHGGGGVGIYGEGTSGAISDGIWSQGGSGGSAGESGDGAEESNGGDFGGGGGGHIGHSAGRSGGNGAVRIVWCANRSFPNTNVSGAW